ncbi:Hypothetical protein LOCK908_0960 [Lacticaseibacillus rhamnosus LOCK908]|uniref:Uncharacterized protein n=1 Tax=Lacticaseibacillus rhamnosus (strain LMS2-1) TaxID=525361 RepID=C2JVQ9_LACRM|nr:hypothetical protein [Lacticaseibacillus rhamnosus]AGP73605.1 Hypothetical protein LOCK908_0960 [Lacticaseibacillus rhamnosus LOCK908]EEN80841.1 hypothetical protein HMPREF0539_0993 [Lacticaseibacillus rhamnosus LMS2-1]
MAGEDDALYWLYPPDRSRLEADNVIFPWSIASAEVMSQLLEPI